MQRSVSTTPGAQGVGWMRAPRAGAQQAGMPFDGEKKERDGELGDSGS